MKTVISSNLKRKWYFSEICHTQFYFHMFYAVKSSEVEEERRKTKKKKEEKQNVKTVISSNLKRKWYFSEIFHTQFYFHMFYAVKSSEVELKLKVRTEFPTYKHLSNPQIHVHSTFRCSYGLAQLVSSMPYAVSKFV